MKHKLLSAILAALLVLSGMIGALGATPPPDADLEMLKSLPDSTGAVVVDIQKILNSEIWAFALSKAGDKNPTNDINLALAKVGMKLADFNSVAIGFSTSRVDMNNFSGVVRGNFNQTALLDTIKQISKAKLTQEQYKNFDIYTVEKTPEPPPAAAPVATSKPADAAPPAPARNSGKVSFTFVDSGTALIGSPSGVRAAIDARTGAAKSLAQNEKLSIALSQVAPGAARFALVPPPEMASASKSSDVPLPDFSTINLIFGSVDLTSGIKFDAFLRNETVDQAKTMADRLNALAVLAGAFLGQSNDPKTPPVGEILKAISVTGNNNDVKISGYFSMDLIAKLIKSSEPAPPEVKAPAPAPQSPPQQ